MYTAIGNVTEGRVKQCVWKVTVHLGYCA